MTPLNPYFGTLNFILLYCKQCIGNKNTFCNSFCNFCHFNENLGNYTILMKFQNLSCCFQTLTIYVFQYKYHELWAVFHNLQSYSNVFIIQNMVIYLTETFLTHIFYKILKMLPDELSVIFVIWFTITVLYPPKISLINDIGLPDSLIFFTEFLVNLKWFLHR